MSHDTNRLGDSDDRQSSTPDVVGNGSGEVSGAKTGMSIMRRRLLRFKSLKRGYYSFLILVGLYAVSFLLPFLINNRALIVHYNGETYFPVVGAYVPGKTFGDTVNPAAEPNYRKLAERIEKEGGDNWVVMPPYHWDPDERDNEWEEADRLDIVYPYPPSSRHWLGTDMSGRDVFARMCYGFNVSISFALMLAIVNYFVGTILGGLMGYYGGKIDLAGQRITEVWSNIPFLFLVIMVSSIVRPNFIILVLLIALFGWIGTSYLMRGEFLREKSRDYVAAAISLGASDRQVIFRHILPNSLTPIIATMPFAIVGGITTLVGLDFLGFGLQGSLPSWGEMLNIGNENKEHLWLILSPLVAMFCTLLLVTFIGEGIREAFDPKVYSRLR